MPSGHANHKGTADKPNTNAEGIIDTAADKSVEPQDLLDEGVDSLRVAEAPANTAATERPKSAS
jgi:hypothetical protein